MKGWKTHLECQRMEFPPGKALQIFWNCNQALDIQTYALEQKYS